MTLPPRAQAHVDDARRDQGATVALEEGTVEVSVVHRAQTRWQIRAGRYQIHVTGTKFSAGWDRGTRDADRDDARRLGRGDGPGAEGTGALSAGQRLRANDVTAAAEPSREVMVEDATTRRARGRQPAPAVEAEPAEAPSPTPSRAGSDRDDDAARGGARCGRAQRQRADAARGADAARASRTPNGARSRRGTSYKEALAAAMSDGLERDCAQLGAEDLVKLGNVARFADDAEHAEMRVPGGARRGSRSADQRGLRPGPARLRPAQGLRGRGELVRHLRETFPERAAGRRSGRAAAGVAAQSRSTMRGHATPPPVTSASSPTDRTPARHATPSVTDPSARRRAVVAVIVLCLLRRARGAQAASGQRQRARPAPRPTPRTRASCCWR